MTRIATIITRLQHFKQNADAMIITLLKKERGLLSELNSEQLLKGEDANGKFITPKYRNPRYAARKQARNNKPPAGTPDLNNTGKYHKSLKEKYSGNKVVIIATDSKDKSLSEKYGDIKGLNATSLSDARDDLLPLVIKELKAQIL